MIEEIRFRVGQKVEVISDKDHFFLEKIVTPRNIRTVLNKLTGYSLYAYEEELKHGFFTVEGGHRVGVVGHVNRKLETLSDIGGLNIRVSHECIGCASEIVPYIQREGSILNTLYVSPPGVGKTTYLRDTIRVISNMGIKVGVVDERSEIGAFYKGTCQNDLGKCTDILDNCKKTDGMRMLLRSMSPRVIAVDELGGKEDIRAVNEILYSGVSLIGTVHAYSVEELYEKLFVKELLMNKSIKRIVLFKKEKEKRSFRIYDTETDRFIFHYDGSLGNDLEKEKPDAEEGKEKSGSHRDFATFILDF